VNADNSRVREIGLIEALLLAVARIYAQMPAEWSPSKNQSIAYYLSMLHVLKHALSNADAVLLVTAARPDDFATAFA